MENKIMELSPMDIKAGELVERIKDLKINGIEDEVGYQIVKEAYIEARDFINNVSELRLDITRQYDDAKKQLITKEREIIAKVEPVKELLGSLKKEIDDEKLKAKIAAALPARKALLEGIELVVSDDELLLMTDDKFQKFFSEKKIAYLEAKENARIAKEQADKEKEAQIERDKLAQENAELKAKNDAIEADNKKLADEAKIAQDKIDAQIAADKEADEARARKILADEKEKKERETNQKYQDFLKECGWSEETKSEFKIFKLETGEIVIYKKVNSIIL